MGWVKYLVHFLLFWGFCGCILFTLYISLGKVEQSLRLIAFHECWFVLNPDDVLLVLIFTFARKTVRLFGLYGLHGPRCSLSPKRPLNLVTHSLCEIVYISMAKHIEAETRWLPFPDDIVKWISLNKNAWISIEISLNFVPRGPFNNMPALVQIMTWRRQAIIGTNDG